LKNYDGKREKKRQDTRIALMTFSVQGRGKIDVKTRGVAQENLRRTVSEPVIIREQINRWSQKCL